MVHFWIHWRWIKNATTRLFLSLQPQPALSEASALGYTYEGLDRTLDSHIKNLRRKIEPDPRNPTYIETVYGVGYRLRGEP